MSTPPVVSSNTLVPVGAVAVVGVALVSIVLWLANVASKAEQAQTGVAKLESQYNGIPVTLGRIEERVNFMYESIKSNEKRH